MVRKYPEVIAERSPAGRSRTGTGNTVPSYALEWRRYPSALTTAFIAERAAIVREPARRDQFVTTCMALSRPAFDPGDLDTALDIAAVDRYYPIPQALTRRAAAPEAALSRPRWSALSGAWAIYLQADREAPVDHGRAAKPGKIC